MLEEKREMSRAYIKQRQSGGDGVCLNECLHPQRFFIELDIKDPSGALVCQAAMSHDQFVRLLLCNMEVPITLTTYRGLDGKRKEEVVPNPDSTKDKFLKGIGEVGESLGERVDDLQRDMYEAINSGKPVGKKALEEMMLNLKVISQHYKSNLPYIVQVAAEEVSDIQENAKSQLAIFAAQHFGADLENSDFTPLLEGTVSEG